MRIFIIYTLYNWSEFDTRIKNFKRVTVVISEETMLHAMRMILKTMLRNEEE